MESVTTCWERLRAGGEESDREDELIQWYHHIYDQCEMIPYCSFDLHLSNNEGC